MTIEEFSLALLLLGYTPKKTVNKYKWESGTHLVWINCKGEVWAGDAETHPRPDTYTGIFSSSTALEIMLEHLGNM
jgi:hypothetical protein